MVCGKRSTIGGFISAIAMLLVVAALAYDVLFEIEIHDSPIGHADLTTVQCGWNRMIYSDGKPDLKYEDAPDADWEKRAGQLWMGFGLLSVLFGLLGALMACVHAKRLSWRKTTITLIFLAGLFAFLAFACAFAGWDSNKCARNDDSSVKVSVPVMFMASVIYFSQWCL